MRRIIWSEEAVQDLRYIYAYYLNENPKAANKLYKKIRSDIRLLIKFPGMAPKEPLLSDERKEFRSLVCMQKFKVIYYVENNSVHISKIWDCRRCPEDLVKDISTLFSDSR